jgi:hypothetical protein
MSARIAVRYLADDSAVATFSFWFRIDPPGSFGLPEEGKTVFPSGLHGAKTPTFHRSMVKVSHGTLSQYRALEDAVNVALSLGTTAVHFQDNFAVVQVEKENFEPARVEAQATVDRLLKHVALAARRSFSAELLVAEDENGNRQSIQRSYEAVYLVVYDLDVMRAAIDQAGRALPLADERLERSLDYYEHALFLIGQGVTVRRGIVSRHYDHTASAIFLNLWKAVTVIIGEPDERDYQSRYRMLGLDYDYFATKITRLKNLRDGYDVAHHHLDADRIEQVKAEYLEAVQIAKEVIGLYRDKLLAETEAGS